MINPALSICIPTYNRKEILGNLLRSIQSLSETTIEVVIVDDGSDDGTADYCRELKPDFNLILVQQENQGRAMALYNSIQNSTGDFIIIMDSDDRFLESAIDHILESLSKYENILSSPKVCGLVFGCVDENKKNIGDDFKVEGINNFLRYRADEGVLGDKKEVVKSNFLKSVLYKPFDSEPRMPTSILWARLARKYDVIAVNSPVAIKEYLKGGMTGKSRELRVKSIRSTLLYYEECLADFSTHYKSIGYGIRIGANYIRYSIYYRSLDMRRLSMLTLPQAAVVIASAPLGILLFFSDLLYWRENLRYFSGVDHKNHP